MRHRFTVRIVGEGAQETAHVLVRRLVEIGAEVCPPGRRAPEGFAGVTVLAGEAGSGQRDDEVIEVSPHDTADFAAEKILDLLAEHGVVSLESEGYTPEEEEQIRKRLSDLGYID